MNRRAIHLWLCAAVIILIAASVLANPPAGGVDGRTLLAVLVGLFAISRAARTA